MQAQAPPPPPSPPPQGKLRWYVENQELLGKNDGLVREQAQVIAKLEERLALAEGAWAGRADCMHTPRHGLQRARCPARAAPEGKAQLQRIRELQAQVAALNQALKSRVPPNSLAAVIEASKPSAEESAAVQSLQKQVSTLSELLSKKVGHSEEGG